MLLSGTLIAVCANAMLKQSDGFSNIILGCLSFLLFGIGIFMYGQAVKTLPIGIAYTVWSGVSVLIVTIIGLLWFKETISPLGILFMVMIITGCIGLNIITK
jgi:small multidrug resistance pump